jgi:hypothetical protein
MVALVAMDNVLDAQTNPHGQVRLDYGPAYLKGLLSRLKAEFRKEEELRKAREAGGPAAAQQAASVQPVKVEEPVDDATQRVNATTNWVQGLAARLPAQHEDYRAALVQQAVEIERILLAKGLPPLQPMLETRRLQSFLSEEQARHPEQPDYAGTIEQLNALRRPGSP